MEVPTTSLNAMESAASEIFRSLVKSSPPNLPGCELSSPREEPTRRCALPPHVQALRGEWNTLGLLGACSQGSSLAQTAA
jgi:hypothetical protein